MGSPKNHDDNTGIIFWDIPYKAGSLEVKGLKEGKEAAKYSVQTSGRSYSIIATTDKTSLSANKDVAHISIRITDQNGLPVMLADDEITCTVSGPARLLGLESANNTDMTNYRDNTHRVYNGKMLAYVQTTGLKVYVNITFSAPWLKPAKVKFVIEK